LQDFASHLPPSQLVHHPGKISHIKYDKKHKSLNRIRIKAALFDDIKGWIKGQSD